MATYNLLHHIARIITSTLSILPNNIHNKSLLEQHLPCTWAVQRVSNLWPGKTHLHTWRSATLIPFEIVSLWLNTLLLAVPPLFEAFLECLFANGLQLGCCVPYVSWLKSIPFQLHFQVGEQSIIARSHVRRVGSLLNRRNVVFGQESLNQLLGMSLCTVMMQLPRSCSPQVRSLVPHSITKAMNNFQVVFFVNVLALWCVLVMHHPTGVKENGQHHSDVAPHLPGLFLASGMLNVSTMTTVPWFMGRTHKPMTHHQWSRCTGIRGRCLRSPACPTWLRQRCFCSIVSRFGTNFADYPQGQIIGQNGMYWTSAYPHLLCKFSDGDTTVLQDHVYTWSMSLSFRLIEGPPERASLSTNVQPSLNQLYHSLICVIPMASSPKTCRIFQMVSTWLSQSFWQNLMQYHCSSCSVIFAENNDAMCTAYTLSHTRWLHMTDAVCWWEKIHVCAWRYPPPPLPQHTSCALLVSM